MTSHIHGLQNTCAQCVITGKVRESKQTAHSSSDPELRTSFILFTSFSRNSSGVLFTKYIQKATAYVIPIINQHGSTNTNIINLYHTEI